MRRSPALDGLRGLAALSIVVLHAWLYTTTTAEKGDSVADGVVHQLRLGVPLFFCLSGFLLYSGWITRAPRLREYAGKRFWRIVPAYALALAGTLALLVPLQGVRGVDVPDTPLLALFAVFASNLHPDTVGALDPPMWTLAVEVQFYALLPLLAWSAIRTGRLVLAPAVLLIGGTVFNNVIADQPGSVVASSSLAALAPCFGAGMLAAVAVHRRPSLRLGGALVLVLAGAALVVVDGAWHEAEAGFAGRVWRDLPAAVGFALVVVALATRGRTWLGGRVLQRLGDLSFPIYLWHMPLMLGLRGFGLFPEGRPVAALVSVLAVTLPVAWISFRFVEQPLLAWSAERRRVRADASGRVVEAGDRRQLVTV